MAVNLKAAKASWGRFLSGFRGALYGLPWRGRLTSARGKDMPERLLDQNESLDHLICCGETFAQVVNVFGVVIIEDIRVVVILDSVTNQSFGDIGAHLLNPIVASSVADSRQGLSCLNAPKNCSGNHPLAIMRVRLGASPMRFSTPGDATAHI